MSGCYAVINVGSQSLKRNGTFTVAFGTSDLCAAETTGNGYLDTLSACTHGSANCLFNSAAEADTSFTLGSDVFANQDSAHIYGSDFEDIDIDIFVSNNSEGFLNVLNTCAAAADYHTRLSCVNSNLNAIAYAFNANLGDSCSKQVLL